jgi:predicted  nucleic acid-binding Zn-ribbon protein
MDKSMTEIMEKVVQIKTELDKVEGRVVTTREHMEKIEDFMEKLSKEIIEGFHIVSSKINALTEEVKHLEDVVAKKQ